MSIVENITVACPYCEKPVEFTAVHSVLADRRPDMRREILANTLQAAQCPHCDAKFRREPRLNYLDIGRGQWLLAKPAADVVNWPDLEAQAQGIFELGYGSLAPAPAQEIGRGLKVRVVFGWPALREKLLAAEHALDDVALECLKVRLLRSLDGPPMADTVELRLEDVADAALTFVWIDADSEAVVEVMNVPRSLYEDTQRDAKGLATLRARLEEGPFVDLNRLLIDPADREALPAEAEA
jgi:endogenous inhibitor of DNA gyrase (YacG/DUF329 family)